MLHTKPGDAGDPFADFRAHKENTEIRILRYAAVSDLTTETLTRYPNPAKMRTSKSLGT